MYRIEKMHPMCLLLFFTISLIVPLMFNNPFFSAISLISAVIYMFSKSGVKAFKTLGFSIVVMIVVSLFNMLFAHYGNTVLFSIKSVEFKLEPLFYGFNQGMVVASVLIWFRVLGEVFDGEKIIYIFRFSPKLALIFSMVLGFIPRFIKKAEDIKNARIGLNGGNRPSGFKEKLSFTLENFSALISYCLESSVITSNSMCAREYNPHAVRYSRFKMQPLDLVFLSVIIISSAFVLVQYFIGNIVFVFKPDLYSDRLSVPALLVFFIIEICPTILEVRENIKWKMLSVKV